MCILSFYQRFPKAACTPGRRVAGKMLLVRATCMLTAVVKVRGGRGLSPLLRFEPPAVNEKVLFYA